MFKFQVCVCVCVWQLLLLRGEGGFIFAAATETPFPRVCVSRRLEIEGRRGRERCIRRRRGQEEIRRSDYQFFHNGPSVSWNSCFQLERGGGGGKERKGGFLTRNRDTRGGRLPRETFVLILACSRHNVIEQFFSLCVSASHFPRRPPPKPPSDT